MALAQRLPISNLGAKILAECSILVSVIKSRTIVYGFALAALGTFFIASGMKIPDFLVLIRLAISVYFLALATYLYNDLTDYDVDKVNNRDLIRNKRMTTRWLFDTNCELIPSGEIASDVIFYYL